MVFYTIAHNTAAAGGGIVASSGKVDISNSTISENTAVSGAGGGILNESASTTLTNVTVSHNDAASGGGIRSAGTGVVALTNSVVASQDAGADCSGLQITSNGHNLDSDGSCLVAPMPGDLPNGNALLGPLQNHGGPTETHALLSGSDAIDGGDDAICAAGPVNNLDQRGQLRPSDGDDSGTAVCDMGAYELHLFGDDDSPLGTNLGPIVDWTTQLPFVDAFKMTRPWIPTCAAGVADCAAALNGIQDDDGWPTELSPSAAVTAVDTHLLLGDADSQNNVGGVYVVLYEGEGTLTYVAGATINPIASSPGRDVVMVDEEGGVQLRISQTGPTNHIRNIRFIKQEYESTYATQPFNPAFLEKAKRFRVLRFMDWMNINREPTGIWAERAQTSDYTYAGRNGVPLEVMVALANEIHITPWFNMPHEASDEYMTQFAILVRDSLNSGLGANVEHTNEAWNPLFPQNTYINNEGQAAFPTAPCDFAIHCEAGLNWHGRRTADMCDIWKAAWGGQSNRVVCVAATRAANEQTAEIVLTCPYWAEGAPCVDHGLDALAIAPYFGGYLASFAGEVGAWTLDQLFLELTDGGQLASDPLNGASGLELSYEWMSDNAGVAAAQGVVLMAYEGGQHLDSGSATADTLFIEANRDPRMGEIYDDYLSAWRANEGCLFVNYTLVQNVYGPPGSWGVLEYINQFSSPKFAAVMNFIDANPWPWANECATGQEMIFYQYLPGILQN